MVIDFLLESLNEILSCSHLEGKDAIKSLYDDLKSITTFINNPHQILTLDLQDMVQHFQQKAYPMLDLMDSSAIIAINNKKQNQPMPTRKKHHVLRVFDPCYSKLLLDFKKEVNSIKKALMDDTDSAKLDSETTPYASGFQIGGGFRVCDEDIFVGFEQQEATVKDRLVGEAKKLQIISIVGMGGIGKTTLAKRLYSDSYIAYRFHVRGWTCVSQNYQKKDVLFNILESVVENEEELHGVCEKKLGEKLYKRLKGRRYLIVVDDIWDVKAWWDLIKSFPDDNNGSRIMVTTRLERVAMEIGKPEVPPHFMSLLSQDESWDLLQKRVFKRRDECPPELVDLGRRMAAKCDGLPLAIVIVGGILAKIERNKERWTEVCERLSLYITGTTTGDTEHKLMAILGQSYHHLPSYLKPCFVYFGAFPEDYEIVVWRLILLWIAEGFVVETKGRTLTCLAEEYLRDLVGRSLVVVSKRSSRRGAKTCRIHDMLRVFCLEKAKEMKIDWYGRVASPETPPIVLGQPLCFHSHGFHDGNKPCFPYLNSTLLSSRSYIYKLLRVLNLWGVYLNTFPEEILKLFHLRFLEIRVHRLDSLPSEISNLWNLEVLIIDKQNWGRVHMPRSFWSLMKLRHLSISDGIEFEQPSASSHGYPPPLLESLQSISALPVSESRMEIKSFFKRIPNLKRVVFYRGPEDRKRIIVPSLANLIQLDSFKLIDNSYGQPHLIIPRTTSFPQNLKKITLSGGHAEWKEMSKLGKLPNLEILKLRRNSFSGPIWETNDGEFSRLKYLKLSFLDLERWICSESIHFPKLEQLVIERCSALLEIPSSLGDVATLEMIEVSWSSHSVSDSALKIQEEQQNEGNDGLKVLVSNPIGDDDGIGMLKFFLEDDRFSISISSSPTP